MIDAPEFQTIAQIKDANARLGHYFFEPSSMRFFASRIASNTVYGGRYFITSEQFMPSEGRAAARKFTIREASADGSVKTLGEFQGYTTLQEARIVAKRLARLIRAGRIPVMGERHCPSCSAEIDSRAETCPVCGIDSYSLLPGENDESCPDCGLTVLDGREGTCQGHEYNVSRSG